MYDFNTRADIVKVKIDDDRSWFVDHDGNDYDYITQFNEVDMHKDEAIDDYIRQHLDFVFCRVRRMVTDAACFLDINEDAEWLRTYADECRQCAEMVDAFVYDSTNEEDDELKVGSKPYMLGYLRDVLDGAAHDLEFKAKELKSRR